jgi:hypothetical protein
MSILEQLADVIGNKRPQASHIGKVAAAERVLEAFVVLPKTTQGFVVTEERIPHTQNGLQQLVNGQYYSANGDVEFWEESIPERWDHVHKLAEEAVKAEAVLAFLREKKKSSAGAARDKRRDELADELAPRIPGLGKNWYTNVSVGMQHAIDRIIEMEDAK